MSERRQDEFIAKHNEVLKLRRKAEELRSDLFMVEANLRDAERESSVMFHNLFNATRR